jgi:tetratricopeptide (TPR) repeat protein
MPSQPSDRRALLAAALLVTLVGLAAYANTFAVPFQYDDLVVLLGEPRITGFAPSPASLRFLGDLSFALCYRLFGERTPGYHLVNLAIHLANALLVYALVQRLARTEAGRGSVLERERHAIGAVAALLFVAHPLQTQAVTYIVQRYTSLAACFFLLAIVSYLGSRIEPRRGRAAAWYALFLAATVAALWTKENAWTLPLVVVTAESLLFRAPLRERLRHLSPFIAGAIALMIAALASGLTLARLDALTRVDTAMPRTHYLLTQLVVVADYLRLLALPWGQNLDPDVPIRESLLQPPVLAALLLHATLVASAIWAARTGRARAPALLAVSLGVAWFYETLLVESSIIPIVDVMYEHRVYLPSVGLFVAAAVLLALLPLPAWSGRKTVATAAVVLLLAALTFARNRVWRDDLSLWTDAAAGSPHKARPLNNVGVAYASRGDPRAAASWFARAMAADPTYSKAWFNLGEALQQQGRCDLAMSHYERFALAHPGYAEVFARLAACSAAIGDERRAAGYRAAYERLRSGAGAAPLAPFYR